MIGVVGQYGFGGVLAAGLFDKLYRVDEFIFLAAWVRKYGACLTGDVVDGGIRLYQLWHNRFACAFMG